MGEMRRLGKRLAVVVWLCFFAQSLGSPVHAASWKCRAELLRTGFVEEFNEAYQRARSSRGAVNRTALALLKRQVAKRVVQTCSTQGDCSLAGIESAIAAEVHRLDQKALKTRASVFLTATLLGSSALSRMLGEWAPKQAPYISNLIVFLTALLVSQVGAPVLEPFTGAVRSKVFGMGTSPEHKIGGFEDRERMFMQWGRMQPLPSQFQVGRANIQGFINLLQQNLLFSANPRTAAFLFANFLIRMKEYPEIIARDPNIHGSVVATFMVLKFRGESHAQAVWDFLNLMDASHAQDEKIRAFYADVIRAWLIEKPPQWNHLNLEELDLGSS